MSIDLHQTLDGKWEDGTRPRDLYADHVSKTPKTYLRQLIGGLSAGNRRVENGCAELCSLLSEDRPDLLYPHVGLFVANLSSKEKVIRWEAVCTLGNLARVDASGVTVEHLPMIIGLLRDKSIVLQGHAVRALAKIGVAHPRTARRVFAALTGAADAFPGNKVGFVIEALGELGELDGFAQRVRRFVEPFATSDVQVVAKKAARVLRRLG